MTWAYRWASETWARGALLAVCLLAAFLTTPVRGADADASRALEKRWRTLLPPRPDTSALELVDFALDAAARDWNPKAVERALELLRGMQEMDPLDRTYGNFRWTYGQTSVLDANAVELCLRHALVLRRDWGARLTPKAGALLHEIVLRGIEGVKRHRIAVSCTSSYLMKAWNCVEAGEQLEIPTLAREGYDMLDEWLSYTARNGIAEFDSPSLYALDLETLGLFARRARESAGRDKARIALRYFWTDIAAHWSTPAARLAGANSHDDEYLGGNGELNLFVQRLGWVPGSSSLSAPFLDACFSMPDAGLVEPLRGTVPRVVSQRWGSQPDAFATLYVGRSFSLGSSGRSSGSDDRNLVLHADQERTKQEIVFFMDGRNDPYGLRKTPDRARRLKARHLTSFVASVQRGPELLQVLSDNLQRSQQQRPSDDFTCLLSQLTLPSSAEVSQDGAPREPGTEESPVALDAGRPLFLKIGPTLVCLRVLFSTDYAGKPAPLHYIRESPDASAKRLTFVHAQGMPWGKGTLAIWLRAAEDLTPEAETSFRKAFAEAPVQVERRGALLRLRVQGLETPLGLEVDTEIGRVLNALGRQPEAQSALLSVNGRDLGRELLAPFVR